MKSLLLAASAALLVTACSTTADEEMAAPAEAAPAGMAASAYVPTAASSDMFEIQSGQLALQRSCDPAVRAFGQMIVDHHSRTSSQLMQAAASAGLPPPPTTLAPHHADMLARLQSASGSGFEGAFRDAQIMAHEEALNLHRSYADSGDLPPLRSVAAAAVPVVQGHLSQAQSLPSMSSCAAPSTTTTSPRPGERG